MKVRKQGTVFDAHQWWQNGDHPDDETEMMMADEGTGLKVRSEGKVVRRFRLPNAPADQQCEHCQLPMHVHGWIEDDNGGHSVCPGDWVITGPGGQRFPCKPNIFDAVYERL